MPNNKQIPIFYYINNKFAIPAIISCYSLIKNIKKDIPLHIIIVCVKLSDENQQRFLNLQKYWSSKGVDISIEFKSISDYNVDFALLTDKIQNTKLINFSEEAYFRLWLSEMVPDSFGISLDADTIIVGDISDLFSMEVKEDEYLLACKHYPDVSKTYKKWLGDRPNTYINSGVILWNFDSIRRDNILDKFIEDLQTNYHSVVEQDTINVVCYGHIGYIPINYNMGNRLRNMTCPDETYTEDDLRLMKEDPKIIHYTSRHKPWIPLVGSFRNAWMPKEEDVQIFFDYLNEVIKSDIFTKDEYDNWANNL